jgi:hypothetical protein
MYSRVAAGLVFLPAISTTVAAFAWGSVAGPGGGPNGGAAYRDPAGGAVREPNGNVAVRGATYYGGKVYRGDTYYEGNGTGFDRPQ